MQAESGIFHRHSSKLLEWSNEIFIENTQANLLQRLLHCA